jgi:integrase
VGVHDLRHSLAAISFEVGLTLPQTWAQLRHANPNVTARVYAGLTEQGRAEIGLKLAEAFGS